jgi:hypothetical protein
MDDAIIPAITSKRGSIARAVLIRALASVCVLSPAACSSDTRSVSLPSFGDVSDAPPAIQTAAQAVVRIETAGSAATGSFVSPTGILLTNNHVLGVEVCPLEGCYAKITFLHQRHSAPQEPQTVFVVPLAVDVGLDIAAVQVSSNPGAAPMDTPHYLTLASRDPVSLQGAHIHVVGHPEGHLKKWAQGQVVDSDGTWVEFTAFSLPGSSGSPLLDDEGHMVGILHRGPTTLDLVSPSGVDVYSIGTASSAIIPAMGAPLPPTMWSINAQATDDDVAKHQVLYLNARAPNATVNATSRPVLTSLGVACDGALSRQNYLSPDDLERGLAPCTQAELWIECRADTKPGGFGVCPDDADGWLQRYQGVYDRWRALNGHLSLDMVSFGPAALTASESQGVSTGGLKLVAALSAADAPLDFTVAAYLAAFNIDAYAATAIADFVHGYGKVPGYALQATDIASAALWLNHNDKLTGPDAISFLKSLIGDDRVDVGSKLYIEDVLYRSGALE